MSVYHKLRATGMLTSLMSLIFLLELFVSSHLVLDLSYDLNNKTLTQFNATQFKLIPVFRGYARPGLSDNDQNNFWMEINDIEGAEHTATHLDAPVHFGKDQWTVDQIPPDRFFGPVSIVDLRDKVKDNADYEITENDLIRWEKVNQRKLDPLIILWTGWASRWPDRLRYMGTSVEDDPSLHHFPGLSQGAAQWIVKHGGIHGVGIDSASMDSGHSTGFSVHRILFDKRIFMIENLNTNDLESFPIVKPYLIVTPLKITGGSGSPVRALLLSQLPKDDPSYSNSAQTKPLMLMCALSFLSCSFYSKKA